MTKKEFDELKPGMLVVDNDSKTISVVVEKRFIVPRGGLLKGQKIPWFFCFSPRYGKIEMTTPMGWEVVK